MSAADAAAAENADNEGYSFVEAYPNKKFTDTEEDFMEPLEMYKKNGFSVIYETEQKSVMRKSLK